MKLRRNKAKSNSKSAFDSRNRSLAKPRPKAPKQRLSVKRGRFTSSNVTLRETALNNKILRIHLPKEDLNSLKQKSKKFRRPSTKSHFIESKSSPHTKSTLRTQNSLSKSPKSKKNTYKIKLYPKKAKSSKMVVNNGKVTKHDPDDYILKRLKSKHSKVYYLKVAPYKVTPEGKLNYKFHQLVNDVKNMQLPTPSWKIKVIIRHNKIAAIIFTNKAELERSVSFNSDEDKYHIVIDNKPAMLAGSPGKVDSCSDIEVLLSVIETIDKDSPMISFK